jgi:hypothetical protein
MVAYLLARVVHSSGTPALRMASPARYRRRGKIGVEGKRGLDFGLCFIESAGFHENNDKKASARSQMFGVEFPFHQNIILGYLACAPQFT